MERAQEGQRRVEDDLRKEVSQLQKSEVEAKRLNEEFKKKVSLNSTIQLFFDKL